MSQKKVHFQDAFANLYNNNKLFDLNIMHALGAVNFRICLALKYHGNSISAQSYDFCPHLAQLDTLDFTLSHRGYRVHNNGYNYLVLSSSI